MPRHIWEVLHTFHSNPTVWWIGQIVGYLFRPSRQLGEVSARPVARIRFDGSSSIQRVRSRGPDAPGGRMAWPMPVLCEATGGSWVGRPGGRVG